MISTQSSCFLVASGRRTGKLQRWRRNVLLGRRLLDKTSRKIWRTWLRISAAKKKELNRKTNAISKIQIGRNSWICASMTKLYVVKINPSSDGSGKIMPGTMGLFRNGRWLSFFGQQMQSEYPLYRDCIQVSQQWKNASIVCKIECPRSITSNFR
mmetsp:Transcript_18924/g.34244  ORF Transcript_18924/g.34244 Transcript_18924/m.34244 type:complete len:155 (+) Transcript_18924:3-467(+)